MDLVVKLRDLRTRAGLTQSEAAERSGIGMKTISSFESGSRIASIRLAQLEQLLAVYGVSLQQFFSSDLERELDHSPRDPTPEVIARLGQLPDRIRAPLAERFNLMLDAAAIGSLKPNHAPVVHASISQLRWTQLNRARRMIAAPERSTL